MQKAIQTCATIPPNHEGPGFSRRVSAPVAPVRRSIVAALFAAAIALSISSAHAGGTGQIIEAENGQKFEIMDIDHTNAGGASAIVRPIGAPGDLTPSLLITFDCHEHMTVYSDHGSGPFAEYVAPRSVGGKIQQIACDGAKRKPIVAYTCGSPPQRACVPPYKEDQSSSR